MTILCYHAVHPEWSSPLAVSPEDFERHARWLAARRRVLPLETALARMTRRWTMPRGTAAITFDDGFACVLENAVPILARLRLPATMFVVARTLSADGGRVDWVDDPPPWRLRTLSADEIVAMRRDGGVAVGSHSFSHRDLTTLSDAECEADLRASREALEDTVHTEVRVLAYPRGRHDARVRRAAERAGFTSAFSLPERAEAPDRFAIPRVGLYRGNGVAHLRVKASGWYLPVRTSSLVNALRRRGPTGPPG